MAGRTFRSELCDDILLGLELYLEDFPKFLIEGVQIEPCEQAGTTIFIMTTHIIS